MAILVMATMPGGTAEQDDAMVKELDLENNRPAGSHARLAGPVDSGWRVVAVWDSEDAFADFRDNRLRPAMERQGLSVPAFEISPLERVFLAG